MINVAQFACDVAVIGAGPAGIAAATVAAEAGKSVVLLDDNFGPGGQIWRGGKPSDKELAAMQWLGRLQRTTARQIFGASVFQIQGNQLAAETLHDAFCVSFKKLVLSTGARELFLPFPGWTLPGVLGAGGLQALIKAGLSVAGKRIVVAGTGPLLLAVAAYAREKGATIVCIAEQTSWTRFAEFGLTVLCSGQKFVEALKLLWRTRGVPHWKNSWPVAALGRAGVESVRIARNGKQREIACDLLACGFHLAPSTDLARLSGCKLEGGFVAVNNLQQTSNPDLFCAGESTGIGGLEKSLIEGQIAGYACAGQLDRARDLAPARAATQRNAESMKRAFALREELKFLSEEDTVVCRCEDVPFGKLREHASWRSAKLQTRCGMGPCQGKVCGAAAEYLFGWETSTVRPPVVPVTCSSLAAFSASGTSESIEGGLQ